MTALFNLFYLYDPWLFHVVRMSFVAGLAALVVLAYQYIKKQKPQGIILPLDSLAVLAGLIVFSVIPLLLNGTKDLSVITMYVKELILFLLGVGLYNAFLCQCKRTTTSRARFANWCSGAICSGHHWLARRIIYD